jgi:hypothetical protein
MGQLTFGALRGSRAALFASLLLATACAPTVGQGSGSGNVITREMIGEGLEESAYTIVQRFRPAWLRARTQGSISDPQVCSGAVCTAGEPSFARVIVDGLVFGDIDSLQRISGAQIESIEYMSALDATTRFGMGYDGGAIIVGTINSRR